MNKKIFIYISIFLISYINSYINGITVSHLQEDIDWNLVKNNNISFAILRIGWMIGEQGVIDPYFEINYNKAKAIGIQVGAYIESESFSVGESEIEAYRVLKELEGKKFEWPIFFDVHPGIENWGDSKKRFNTFMNILKQNNYYCGIRSTAKVLSEKFKDNNNEYAYWVAEYNKEFWDDDISLFDDWGIWQYSSNGSVDGINGDVDMNYARIDYPDIIISKGFNGY
jgi:GH25 family lysozyme M1 (1,4-beta-N-acetylmuramidase)